MFNIFSEKGISNLLFVRKSSPGVKREHLKVIFPLGKCPPGLRGDRCSQYLAPQGEFDRSSFILRGCSRLPRDPICYYLNQQVPESWVLDYFLVLVWFGFPSKIVKRVILKVQLQRLIFRPIVEEVRPSNGPLYVMLLFNR